MSYIGAYIGSYAGNYLGDVSGGDGGGGEGGTDAVIQATTPFYLTAEGETDSRRFQRFEGSTAVRLIIALRQGDGDPFPLDGTETVAVYLGDGAGTVAAGAGTTTLAYAPLALVYYDAAAADVATAAEKTLYVRVTNTGGAYEEFGPLYFDVLERL